MDVKERLSNVMYLVYIVWLTELSKGYLDIVITTKRQKEAEQIA